MMRNDDECPGNPSICDHTIDSSMYFHQTENMREPEICNEYESRILAKISKEANCWKGRVVVEKKNKYYYKMQTLEGNLIYCQQH